MNTNDHYINQIEIVTSLFTVEKGKIKVLLFSKQDEPYKGYWMLPSNLLMTTETVEECASETIYEFSGLKDVYLIQNSIFSDIHRLPGARILANSLIGMIDIETVKEETKKTSLDGSWFDIHEIPKMVYDHGDIVLDAITSLKKQLLQNDYLMKKFYPHEFTLPELQSTYEHLLNKPLDRRNFRKKWLHLNLLEDTMDQNTKTNGRPARLYCFKENLKENIYE